MSGRAWEANAKKRKATGVRPLILRCQAAAFTMGFACRLLDAHSRLPVVQGLKNH